ncbi:hypothetical protein BA724_00475 [Domibacillus iocasae]|uniref:Uncharacterized protein n=1 Tax=Domibacillus iocasae TaxID=1714016 RepID=A0A1E7DU04_9BACI|nr:hypothetical protein BA724_00475 [Domibacillus iocasae]
MYLFILADLLKTNGRRAGGGDSRGTSGQAVAGSAKRCSAFAPVVSPAASLQPITLLFKKVSFHDRNRRKQEV